MPTCITIPLLLIGIIFFLTSVIRWFDIVAVAVDSHDWQALQLLLLCPPMCWRYATRVASGRPVPVRHHEPVRGFGKVPLENPASQEQQSASSSAIPQGGLSSDAPPPGTPAEFLGMPKIPPKAAVKKPAVDPEKLAKLKAKMREQGMLPPEDPQV